MSAFDQFRNCSFVSYPLTLHPPRAPLTEINKADTVSDNTSSLKSELFISKQQFSFLENSEKGSYRVTLDLDPQRYEQMFTLELASVKCCKKGTEPATDF